MASVPLGVLVATILYVNEVPDHDSDRRAGKRHLVVILGKARAARWLPAFFLCAYSSIVAGVALGIMPVWTLVSLATVPVAASVCRIAASSYDDTKSYVPAQARTIAIHSATGLLLAAGYLAAALAG